MALPCRSVKRSGGFTLVEVVVALGIAAGALILVLSANNDSLRRSVRSRETVELALAVESKYHELVLKVELQSSGELSGLPGWRWSARREWIQLAGLESLRQMTLVVLRPDGSKAVEWTGIVEAP